MAAFNARDLPRWAATFNYPSVRLARGRLIIFESASHRPDGFERLAGIGGDHSAWDHHRVINSSDDKVHFDTCFTRYRADGSIIAAIIVTQTPTNQPSEPRGVPGPASMRRSYGAGRRACARIER